MTDDDCLCEYRYDFWVELTARLGKFFGWTCWGSIFFNLSLMFVLQKIDIVEDIGRLPRLLALIILANIGVMIASVPAYGTLLILHEHLFEKLQDRYWQAWFAREKQKASA